MQVCKSGRTELNELNSFSKGLYFVYLYKSLNNYRQTNSLKILNKKNATIDLNELMKGLKAFH